MQITFSFNTSTNTAPSAFEMELKAVAAWLDAVITTPLAVTINVGWSEIDGAPLSNGGGESEADSKDFNYAEVRAALLTTVSGPAETLAFSTLPIGAPAGDATIELSGPQAAALGLGDDAMGWIGFDSTVDWNYGSATPAAGSVDLWGVAVHEITEVLGRTSNVGSSSPLSLLDLFRYSAPGVLATSAAESAYFSIDGGTTDLADFNTAPGGDSGDWAYDVSHDAFDAFIVPGIVLGVSQPDLSVMAAIGYSLATAAPKGGPVILGTDAGQAVWTAQIALPFAHVVLADPSAAAALSLTVTSSNPSAGTFTNPAGGIVANGTYSVSGSLAIVNAALDALGFAPAAGPAGSSATSTFTIALSDGATSTTNTMTSVIARTPAPIAIGGARSDRTVQGGGTLAPFGGVTIGDPNNLTDTVTVTLSSLAFGDLLNPGLGQYDIATGVYIVSGAAAVVQSTIDGLIFQAGSTDASSVSTTFEIIVTDGLVSQSDTTSSVVVITSESGPGSELPDLSAILPLANASALERALAIIAGGKTFSVVTVSGVAMAPAPAAGALNALVIDTPPVGSTVTLAAGYQIQEVLGGNGLSVEPPASKLIVDTGVSDAVFGANGDTLIGGDGPTSFILGSGAEDVVGGGGANTIWLGAGAASIQSQGVDTVVGSTGSGNVNAAGSLFFFGGSGDAVLTLSGTAATIAGGGAETVNAGSANTLAFGGTGPLTFNAGSGASTVVGGAAPASIVGGSGGMLFFGAGSTSYVGGSGVDTVIAGIGSMTATGGSAGTLFFTGAGGGSFISSGLGSSTIVGCGAGDVLTATGRGDDIVAATGAGELIDATSATGFDSLVALGTNDVIRSGVGPTAIVSAGGNQTLVAGIGPTLIVIPAGSTARTVAIENFDLAKDRVQLQSFGSRTPGLAIENAFVAAGNTVVALPDGTQLVFASVTNLTPASFDM